MTVKTLIKLLEQLSDNWIIRVDREDGYLFVYDDQNELRGFIDFFTEKTETFFDSMPTSPSPGGGVGWRMREMNDNDNPWQPVPDVDFWRRVGPGAERVQR